MYVICLQCVILKTNKMTQEKQATLIATGKQIMVYKSKLRGTWINSFDCETEYKPEELKF